MRQRFIPRPALGVVVLCLLSASLVCATPVTVAVTTSATFEHALCTEENFTPLGHGYGACEWVFTAPTHARVIVNIDHLFLFGFERALFYDGASAASPLINGCERGEYYSSFLERPDSMTPVYSEYWNYYYELPVEAISLSNSMYVRVIVWINSPFNVSMEILAGASTVHNPNHADVSCALNDYIPTPAAPAPPPAPTVVPITQAVQSIEVSAGYGVSFVEGATWILQAEDGYAVQVNMTDVFLAADECIVIYDGGSTATPVIFSGCGVDYYYSSSYSTFSSSSYSSSSSPDGTTTGVTTTASSQTTTGGSLTTTVGGTTMNGGTTTAASMSGSSSSDNDTSSASSMSTSPSGTTDPASSATTTQPSASTSTTTAPGTTTAGGATSTTSAHGGTTSPAATGTTTDHEMSTTTSDGGAGGGGSSGSSTLYSAYTDFVFPLSSGPEVTILLFSWGESSYYYYYGCASITARAEVDLDGPPPPMTTTGGSGHYATTHGAATTTASGNGGTTTILPGTAPNPTTLGGSTSGTTGAAASASGGDGSSPAALQALGANAPSAGLSTGGVAAVSIGSIAFVAIVVAVIIAVVLARRRNTSAAAAHARDNTMVDANEMAHEFVDLDAPLRNAPHHSVKPPSSEGEEEEETERAERVANTAGPAPRATSTATNGPRRPSVDDDTAV